MTNGTTSTKATMNASEWTGCDDWEIPDYVKTHKYFVEVTTTLVAALQEIDKRMEQNGDYHLITRKTKRVLGGALVEAGQVGIWNRNGMPIIAIEPGNYWNFSLRQGWHGKFSITEPLDALGLTSVLVGQSEAAVVLDPSNKVFIVRNSGFAAYGAEGRFKVVAIVDTLNLGDEHAVYEMLPSGRGGILGWKREVKMTVGNSRVTIATFLNTPANNCAIVQRSNDLLLLQAGQHVITNSNTSFRGFYSLGERQTTFRTQPAYTVEGVPVVLNVNLRYRISDPLLLTASYDAAFVALQNPAQTAVNAVVSRLSYLQFMRAQKISGDIPDTNVEPWLDAFRKSCLRDLRTQAESYGVIVESFEVLDRELDGALGKDLERQSESVLRNQVQATQVQLQNHIATETQRGRLEIARVEAEQRKTESDARYYSVLKGAQADAESSDLKTQQETKNIVALADAKKQEIEVVGTAYAQVPAGHAQTMQLSVFEVEKRKALPEKTIYFGGDAVDSSGGRSKELVAAGLEVATGWNLK
ncbi:hypothetical protein BC830DRAFT_1257003 [Chytriomyces sp. MP71]|nr:hypothetical protein BC830DRAFT_1257003 [Chytriomyces sp. MP71]